MIKTDIVCGLLFLSERFGQVVWSLNTSCAEPYHIWCGGLIRNKKVATWKAVYYQEGIYRTQIRIQTADLHRRKRHKVKTNNKEIKPKFILTL